MTSKTKKDECPHLNTIEKDGFQVCTTCAVAFDRVYSNQILTSYDHAPSSRLHHAIIPANATGNRTVFNPNEIESGGSRYYKLRKRSNQFIGSSERAVRSASEKLRGITQRLGLNISKEMQEDIITLYNKIRKKKVKRVPTTYTITAIIYIVIRQRRIPFSLRELASSLKLKQMRVRRYSKEMCEQLGIVLAPITLKGVAERLLGMLNADADVLVAVFQCIESIDLQQFTGIDPKGLAATIVYLVGERLGKKITQSQIAKVTRPALGVDWISEITLRTNIKRLKAKGCMPDYITHHYKCHTPPRR